MRGRALLCICMHNLLHLVCPAKECEFGFYPVRVERLFATPVSAWNLVECFFSYFGWYAILVFVMLSGYGLVCKHERPGAAGWDAKAYLRHNFRKLFVLLAPGYLLFLLLSDKTVAWTTVVAQLAMVINLIDVRLIDPSVYWYLGLTLQLYVAYLFFHRWRSAWWLVAVSVGAIMLAMALMRVPDVWHEQVRYNAPVWLPVFAVGMAWARAPHAGRAEAFVVRHGLLSAVLLVALWLWSAIDSHLWALSPLLAILAFAVMAQGLASLSRSRVVVVRKCAVVVGRLFSFMGSISAGVYVCHPIVRIFAAKAIIAHVHVIPVTAAYMVASVLAGYGYTLLYKRLS